MVRQDAKLRAHGKALLEIDAFIADPMQHAMLLIGVGEREFRDRMATDVAYRAIAVIARLRLRASVAAHRHPARVGNHPTGIERCPITLHSTDSAISSSAHTPTPAMTRSKNT